MTSRTGLPTGVVASRQAGTNRTRSPGRRRAGGVRGRVEQRGVRPAEEPPAAGRGLRVDRGHRAGDRDAAGRHARSGVSRAAARERGRELAEVREAGREPEEQDLVRRARRGAR